MSAPVSAVLGVCPRAGGSETQGRQWDVTTARSAASTTQHCLQSEDPHRGKSMKSYAHYLPS